MGYSVQLHDDADDQPPVGKITLESKNLSLQHPSQFAGISLIQIHINTFNTNKKEPLSSRDSLGIMYEHTSE